MVNEKKIDITMQIELGIKYRNLLSNRIPRILITRVEIFIQDVINNIDTDYIAVICGSYRRNFDFSSDIDILLCDLNLITMENILNTDNNYLSDYVKYLHKIDFLIDDITDKNIKTKYMGFGQLKSISNSYLFYSMKRLLMKGNLQYKFFPNCLILDHIFQC
jgi:DNA polymerase beta